MEYLDTECCGIMGIDQVCQETVNKENMDMALLKMMMDMGYENTPPHHYIHTDLPYLVHILIGAITCAAGNLCV